MAGAGWVFAVSGALATAAGTTVIPLTNDGELTRNEKRAAASLTATGVVLALISRAWFKRADAASKLASETSAILGGFKEVSEVQNPSAPIAAPTAAATLATSRCNTALAAWESARTDVTAVANSLLEQKRAEQAKAEQDTKKQIVDELGSLLEQACPDAGDCPDQVKALKKLFKATAK